MVHSKGVRKMFKAFFAVAMLVVIGRFYLSPIQPVLTDTYEVPKYPRPVVTLP